MSQNINLALNSGYSMPALGYGTWQAHDEDLEKALEIALEAGYRHIDTAWLYNNEHVIGKVIKKWIEEGKVTREELFIVTKLPHYGNRASQVEHYLNGSLKNLQLTYVDLYLIHIPVGLKSETEMVVDPTTDLLAIWKEMEKQVDNGKTKSIGVSNFNERQMEKIIKNGRIPPATNQIELHAYLQQPALVEFMKKNNIVPTAYSPLGSLGAQKFFNDRGISLEVPNLLENTTIKNIAKAHNKTAAQILLRHAIQKGFAAIPKSTNPKRIKENISIFDFELSPEEMDAMNGLDKNLRIILFSKVFPGSKDHPEYPFDA